VISRDPDEVQYASKLILPGVGAFETGMEHLTEYGLVDAVKQFAASGKPMMGICLGMQLLMSTSYEKGVHQGLNLIPGKVTHFREPENGDNFFKIPQIGWNSLQTTGGSVKNGTHPWKSTILEGLVDDPFMYFLHSYCVNPEDTSYRMAETEYGHDRFCSVIKKDNIVGCQFHPERSGDQGLHILKNFVSGKL
jgi:imidazole glycerol-phosphate synthase subunit HisH